MFFGDIDRIFTGLAVGAVGVCVVVVVGNIVDGVVAGSVSVAGADDGRVQSFGIFGNDKNGSMQIEKYSVTVSLIL